LTKVFDLVNWYRVVYLDDVRGRILEGQQKTFREKGQERKNLTLFYRKEKGME